MPEPVRSAYDAVCLGIYDNVIKPYAEPSREKLLPDLPPQNRGVEPRGNKLSGTLPTQIGLLQDYRKKTVRTALGLFPP